MYTKVLGRASALASLSLSAARSRLAGVRMIRHKKNGPALQFCRAEGADLETGAVHHRKVVCDIYHRFRFDRRLDLLIRRRWRGGGRPGDGVSGSSGDGESPAGEIAVTMGTLHESVVGTRSVPVGTIPTAVGMALGMLVGIVCPQMGNVTSVTTCVTASGGEFATAVWVGEDPR